MKGVKMGIGQTEYGHIQRCDVCGKGFNDAKEGGSCNTCDRLFCGECCDADKMDRCLAGLCLEESPPEVKKEHNSETKERNPLAPLNFLPLFADQQEDYEPRHLTLPEAVKKALEIGEGARIRRHCWVNELWYEIRESPVPQSHIPAREPDVLVRCGEPAVIDPLHRVDTITAADWEVLLPLNHSHNL
jgi:hypothetical protein